MVKSKMSLCTLLLCLIAASPAHSDEGFIGYGVGVFNDANQHLGQMKVVQLGYRHFLFNGVYWQNKVGFWGEGSTDHSRSSSGWLSTGIGQEVDLHPVEIRTGYGVAAITSPDSQLGSVFPQFNGEIYLGLRDKDGDGFGIQYEHISCASFCSPNQGRDMVTFQIGLKWD